VITDRDCHGDTRITAELKSTNRTCGLVILTVSRDPALDNENAVRWMNARSMRFPISVRNGYFRLTAGGFLRASHTATISRGNVHASRPGGGVTAGWK